MAGKQYGTGSSRDWAAKGPKLLGVRVVIAESYERIHRSNLVGMGVLPLEFLEGEGVKSLGLTGYEGFSVDLKTVKKGGLVDVKVTGGEIETFKAKVRIDTDAEYLYWVNDGILVYVLKKLMK